MQDQVLQRISVVPQGHQGLGADTLDSDGQLGAASQGVGLKQKRAEEASFVCGKEPLLEGEGAGIHHPPGIAKDPESNCHAAVACGPAGIAPRLVSEHVGDRSIPLLVSRASDDPKCLQSA